MAVVKAMEFLSKTNEILLASGSPRRLELIQKLNAAWISQLAIPESVENLNWKDFKSPREYVEVNVKNKLEYALGRLSKRNTVLAPQSIKDGEKNFGEMIPSLVVAADTVVVDGNQVLEKPKSVEHNYQMIQSLSGKKHTVLTAVAFTFLGKTDSLSAERGDGLKESLPPSHRIFCTETKVQFMNLNEETMRWYAESKEGSDKAGGYAIQGLGAALIESVEGDFYNVVGFPVNQFVVHLNSVLP